MQAAIAAVDYFLPEGTLSNVELAAENPDWSVDKIRDKTGIDLRHIAGEKECSSDLACRAAEKLFASGACRPEEIDFLLFCTQSPDYFLPTTACVLQHRLKLPTTAGALDFNLGCSGYVFGLSLAKGLIETGQARRVLLLTGETYSKFIHPQDRSVRTLFGDAGSATVVTAVEPSDAGEPCLGPFVFGTDGRGANNLIVPAGGMRQPATAETARVTEDAHGNRRSANHLFMNGAEIFTFTLKAVPQAVRALLQSAAKSVNDVDYFVFHQANKYMLDHLRQKVGIPAEKFPMALSECGNTVSATIPITLRGMMQAGQLRHGTRLMLVGFGVGYSWAANMVRWHAVAPDSQVG